MHASQRLLFAAQLASTLAMFGIIWFVQLAHYPTFLQIDPANFPRYEAAYTHRMGFVAGPLMLAELGSSLLLLAPALRPAVISARQPWLGLALVGVLWASTVFVQIPLHDRLHTAYSASAIRMLVATNWLRTAAWTARASLVLFWADRLLTRR